MVYKPRQIPAPYDRIVAQLIKEDEHAKFDDSHEALRRQTYAQRILDEFWKEIRKYDGPAAEFRSKVLTPILQRQLYGIDENYTPSVREAINGGPGDLTIKQATSLYLGDDPTHPGWIPTYRRNLVYVTEPRWHLGVVLGKYKCGDHNTYISLRAHQDVLDDHIRKEAMTKAEQPEDEDGELDGTEDDRPRRTPFFTEAEVEMIVLERLDDFFAGELLYVVGQLILGIVAYPLLTIFD